MITSQDNGLNMNAPLIGASNSQQCCVCNQYLAQIPRDSIKACKSCSRQAHFSCIQNSQNFSSNGEWRCNMCISHDQKMSYSCIICKQPTSEQIKIAITTHSNEAWNGNQQQLQGLQILDETTIYGHHKCLINQDSPFLYNSLTGTYQISQQQYAKLHSRHESEVVSPERQQQRKLPNFSAHTVEQTAKPLPQNIYQPQLNTQYPQQNQYKPANLQSLLARYPKNLQNQTQSSNSTQILPQGNTFQEPLTDQSQNQLQQSLFQQNQYTIAHQQIKQQLPNNNFFTDQYQQSQFDNQEGTITDYFQRKDVQNLNQTPLHHQHNSANVNSATNSLNPSSQTKQPLNKIKLDFHTERLLGKRQRSAGNNELITKGLSMDQKEELKHDLDMLKQGTIIDDQMSGNQSNQRESRDRKSKNVDSSPGLSSEMTKNKIQKALDADPSIYVLKEILNPIMFQIDKLQLMKEDKRNFEIVLLNKDLKLLSKERREEIMNATGYFDIIQKPDSLDDDLVFILDHKLPQRLIDLSRSSNLQENDLQIKTLSGTDEITNQQIRLDSDMTSLHDRQEDGSPSLNKMEVDEEEESHDPNNLCDDMQDEDGQIINGGDVQMNSENVNKKKKKKKAFGNSGKNKNISKALLNLPHNLSDFTWIENTQFNKTLLEEERLKLAEIKRQKEQERKNKLQESESDPSVDFTLKVQKASEEVKQEDQQSIPQQQDQLEDTEMIDTTTTKPQNQETPQPTSQQPKQEKEPYKYISSNELTCIDDIWRRADSGCHHSLDDLLKDIELLIRSILKQRCQNLIAKVYLSLVLQRISNFIKTKKEEHKQKWRNFYEAKFAQNDLYYPRIKGQWWKSPGPKREYNLIENYKIVTPAEPSNKYLQGSQVYKQEIYRKMQTTKSSACDGTCCLNIEDLGPFKLGSDVWESKCQCRLKRVECSETCGCDPSQCQNRQMSQNQALKLDIDVEEKISWGIDMGTAVNLMSLLPKDMPLKMQSEFIEKKVVFAIHQQGDQGYDVREALKFIINDKQNPRFKDIDRELAQIVLSGIRMVKDGVERHFRVHSKGIGIFCKRKEGIKASNLIIEYFGEIYQPWNWYEKQDVLKQGQNKQTLSKDLPDFYNITFERHPDDPQGYDILMVDPILYGNYSSRLSHSCNPNCSTIIHVRQGQYSIGMFAIKDISYGEELCFNYCSLTESEKEYEAAICLCGTEVCQGKYLQLANDKKHMAIMKKYHTFVDRNYILYKACKYPEITPEDEKRLQDFGLKESVLTDVPDWLKKWASLICEYIIFEEDIYPAFFKAIYPSFQEEDLKIEAKNQRDSKIWNIAITIDKVMHVLKSMGVLEPPIKDLTYKERCVKLWDAQGSLRESLIEVLNQIENCQEKLDALQKVLSVNYVDGSYDDDENGGFYKEKFQEIQSAIALISGILRTVKSNKVMIPALCDALWLYANTNVYFTPNENYKKCKGDEQKIRKCDVRLENLTQQSLHPVEQEKQVYRGFKEYDPSYVWGQLVGWFKQTVDKPNASLSADRRGTLSMPDLESFVVSAKNQENLKSGIKRKKTKKGSEDEQEEEIMPQKKQGTKSRPMGQQQSFGMSSNQDSISQFSETGSCQKQQYYKDPKIIYPHKKHQTRQAFLENWPENFSKQWDVVCHWSFKNKNRMYGSVQFESILQADTDRSRRLYYFQNVLNYLKNQ